MFVISVTLYDFYDFCYFHNFGDVRDFCDFCNVCDFYDFLFCFCDFLYFVVMSGISVKSVVSVMFVMSVISVIDFLCFGGLCDFRGFCDFRDFNGKSQPKVRSQESSTRNLQRAVSNQSVWGPRWRHWYIYSVGYYRWHDKLTLNNRPRRPIQSFQAQENIIWGPNK